MWLQQLFKWFAPPTFPDDETKTLVARRLNTLTLTVIVVLFVAALVTYLEASYLSTMFLLVGGAVSLGVWWLVRSGRLEAPRWVLPVMMLVMVTAILYAGEGVGDIAILSYPAVIVLAGLLNGRSGTLVFTILSILAIAFLIFAEVTQLIVPRVDETNYGWLLLVALILIATAVALNLLIQDLTHIATKAREQEEKAKQANRELERIKESLERQVDERTQRAEIARRDAEDAHEAMEELLWMLAGQTQLYDQIRGEIDVEALANRVVEFVCDFLKMPVGTLFVHQESGWLTLAGSYAFKATETHPEKFAVGDGLMGTVAQEKTFLILDELPEDYLLVGSASGVIQIRHLLLMPFVHRGQLFGVLELGSQRPFTSKQVDFVQNTAESVAITLQTIQALSRVDELLVETEQKEQNLAQNEAKLREMYQKLSDYTALLAFDFEDAAEE